MSSTPDLEIPFHRFIDETGEVVQKLPAFAADSHDLVALYRAMVLTRIFDERAVNLQRTGRLGTYASSLGQEAVGVGVAAAMQDLDVLLPSFREQGAMLWRGVTMAEILQYWGGDERGSDFSEAASDFPICIPVGTHFPHAVGVAFALKQQKVDAAAVVIAGDGATSRGDFYEAMNIAGLWRLPAVFVINNNQWAISVSRSRQTASQTLAQKSVAAGILGLQVDGNDVVAVRQSVKEALERARNNGVATVIEAITYRLTDHTTADDASRYRSDQEVSEHWQYEPVRRLRQYLEKQHEWSAEDEETLQKQVLVDTEDAVQVYLDNAAPKVESMFDHLFKKLPEVLARQREHIINRAGKDG
ncbi:MAG: pyruvate dehydrogenase (acetyl-transferring) E1 component subunit alpha [bacterium]